MEIDWGKELEKEGFRLMSWSKEETREDYYLPGWEPMPKVLVWSYKFNGEHIMSVSGSIGVYSASSRRCMI